ncbi:LacI family transcriptional regulator [Aliiruegeria lutimaris]|uniref:Transcriptional regulator, LacI family n=1 Tax=Aliiruegeria lutimaris TaxID=571298 RepID=A0A1G9GPS4_9RHOB|nr:LacI family transcriptional regulator [Aliiruegeria lutimaris]SDL02691.1 transcriptional regulator, LacI family [Aliiruegeria lutimaris]
MRSDAPSPPASKTAADRPTLKTIADLSGFAVATVSRALAEDPKIAESTRRRVAEIARQIGYEPDRAARRLRTGRTMVINLILDPHFEVLGFGNALLIGLTTALEGSGYNLVVTPHFDDTDELAPIRHIVVNRQADGVIFTRTAPFDSRARFLMEHGFPFVSHGRTDFTEEHSWVDFDNEEFAYRGTLRLIEKGCRKVCAILPPKTLTFRQHLQYGFMRAVREFGIDTLVPDVITLDTPADEIRDWACGILDGPNRPDGFLCPGEASYLAIRSACQKCGLVLGRDLWVVSKSISGVISQIDPEADTIQEDVEQAGRLMAQHLLTMLSEPSVRPPMTLQSAKPLFL